MAQAYNWSGDETRWFQAQKLASLDPAFRARVEQTMRIMRQRGWEPHIVYGWRSVETQARLKAAGASKVDFSFHNAINDAGQPAALAVDLIDKRYGWGNDDRQSEITKRAMGFFFDLGDAGKSTGLHWGGDWITFKDYAHLQAHPNAMLTRIRDAAADVWARLRDAASAATETITEAVAPSPAPDPTAGSSASYQNMLSASQQNAARAEQAAAQEPGFRVVVSGTQVRKVPAWPFAIGGGALALITIATIIAATR